MRFSDELRQYANYDSRAGEPLGQRMQRAADLLDSVQAALETISSNIRGEEALRDWRTIKAMADAAAIAIKNGRTM